MAIILDIPADVLRVLEMYNLFISNLDGTDDLFHRVITSNVFDYFSIRLYKIEVFLTSKIILNERAVYDIWRN